MRHDRPMPSAPHASSAPASQLPPVPPLPDLKGHRFALTGAAGFLGRHVIRLLHRQGARIIALRRAESRPLPDATVQEAIIDLNDEAACAQTLQVNLVGSINLVLGAMDRVPDCRVVVAGSMEAANPWQGPLALGSPYGMSKAMVEVLTGSLNRLYGTNVLNMRIGMAYGEDDPNHRRLVPSVILSLLQGRAPAIGNPGRLCDWIHAEDVAEALIRGALLPRAEPASIDVGNGRLGSIADVVAIIQQLLGTELPLQPVERLQRSNEQARCADLSAMTAALGGWRPRIGLEEGLARAVAGYRQELAEAR